MPEINSIRVGETSYQLNIPPATSSTLGGVKIGSGIRVDDDGTISVYVDRFPITYHLDGGNALNPSSYTKQDEISLVAPIKTGYTFIGWTGSNGNIPETTVTITLGTEGNLEFTANYTRNQYTVTFNVDGLTTTEQVYYGDTVNEPIDPSKNGYAFNEWTLNGSTFDFNTPITESITLTATWNLITYNITYILNDGIATNIGTYSIETPTFTLNNPTKEHYDFIGWTGSNGDTPQTIIQIVQGSYGNKSFEANYELSKYIVTYKKLFVTKNGDTISETTISTEQITYGETVSSIPTLTNETSYSSDLSWYESDKITLFNPAAAVTENKTLYGIYIRQSVTYGFKVSLGDSNPNTRVVYTDDAVNLSPASMNYSTGQFDYGDWANAWFIKDNYPVALKYDGTEDYKLNPNDYSKKIDGTSSNWNSTSYEGNFMSAIPKIYFYRYTETVGGVTYRCCKISDTQIDNNYKCYAHIGQDGNEKDYVYLPMFKGCYSSSKIRSIGGQTPGTNTTGTTEKSYAEANGSGWQLWDFSMHEMITDLLVLISKSTDTQSKFGQGWTNSNNSIVRTTGSSLYNKGQFWGENVGSNNVKVFHIEDFWGNRWDRCLGYMIQDKVAWIKPIPPYVMDSTYSNTYTNCGSVLSSSGYITAGLYKNNYGFIPTASSSGSSSTYECDYAWTYSGLQCARFGSSWGSGSYAGAFYWSLGNAASDSGSSIGGSCAFRKP